MSHHFSQRGRLLLLACEIGLLCLASYLAFGTAIPPNGDKGFWFYVSLLGLVLGSRLDTPFFVKPADAILYAASAAVALALANHWGEWTASERAAYIAALAYPIGIGLVATVAVLTLDPNKPIPSKTSAAMRLLAETLGTPTSIFSTSIFFALFAFHRNAPNEFALILGAWFVTGFISPVDMIARLVERLRRVFGGSELLKGSSDVAAYQTPGIVLCRSHPANGPSPGDPVAVNDPSGVHKIYLALDYVGRDESVLLRLVEMGSLQREHKIFRE